MVIGAGGYLKHSIFEPNRIPALAQDIFFTQAYFCHDIKGEIDESLVGTITLSFNRVIKTFTVRMMVRRWWKC
jgi:hypothetical protein